MKCIDTERTKKHVSGVVMPFCTTLLSASMHLTGAILRKPYNRGLTLATLSTALFLVACSHNTTNIPASISQQNIDLAIASLDANANRLLRLTGVPGMAIAVVHNDKVVYAKGFGVCNIKTNKKVDPDTVFLLASVSKSLAATVVAGAVGQGNVSWNDPVAKYLTDFTLSNPSVGAKVTIADMFAHRSGLPDHAGDLLEDIGYKRNEIIYRLRYEPLRPYLVTYDYTNFGLTAGAEAIAVAQHTSWEDLSEKILYKPLGMTSTSSRWSDYNNNPRKADIHNINANGKWVISSRIPDQQSPAGGASSSVNDFAKWMILAINQGTDNHGVQIINKAALQLTQERQIMSLPASSGRHATYYGLGTNVSYDDSGRLHLSHSGAFAMGTGTAYELLPSEKLGIVVLTNGIPLGVAETISKEFLETAEYGRVQHDWYSLIEGYFKNMLADKGSLVGKQPPANPAPARPLNEYAGVYQNDFYGPAKIEVVGQSLQLVVGPSPMRYPMTHWNGDKFSFETTGENKTGISAIQFTPATNGQPAKMEVEYFNADGLGTFVKGL